MVFEGRRWAGCQVAVEFQDPDGNNLETDWNIDQIGTNSAARPASERRQANRSKNAVQYPVAGRRLPRSAEAAPASDPTIGSRRSVAPLSASGTIA